MSPTARIPSICIAALFLWVTTPVFSHILLESPNGGEVLVPETTIEISWLILVTHDVQGWDVHYSTEGVEGPWVPIALGLPVGDASAGAVHTLDWNVPLAAASPQVWIKVRMDNMTADDLLEFSDAPFSVG